MKTNPGFLRKAFALAFAALVLSTAPLRAAWTSFDLAPLTINFGAYPMDHLPDGRLVQGSVNDLDLQNTFGASTLGDFTNALTWEPSAVSIFTNTLGAIGQGSFGPSAIYLFDPSNLATTFTPIAGVSLQNYSLTFRNSTSLYVGGLNGSQMNSFNLPKHAISFVTTDGATNKVIIDNVSNFSGAFATDLLGNLYLSNNDTLGLYRFTLAQLAAAIVGAPLAITDGQFLTTLPGDSSLAVDALGRILSTGFGVNGIAIYDPIADTHGTVLPALNNSNYIVSTFSDGINDFVAYINASGSAVGSTLTYGYDKVENVPEPTSALLLGFGGLILAASRRRNWNRHA